MVQRAGSAKINWFSGVLYDWGGEELAELIGVASKVRYGPKFKQLFSREIYLKTEVFSWSILFVLFTLRTFKEFLLF